MSRLAAIPRSRPFLWAILALPAVWAGWRYASGAAGYGETLNLTGDLAVWLFIVTLAVSPLRRVFPRRGWAAWLARRRRDLGVAAFAYAAVHTGLYLHRKSPMPELIAHEAVEPGMAVGWVALLAMLLLAATSNDASVRRLKAGWRRLHRLAYPAAALVMAHWILTAFDPLKAWLHAAVVALLLAARALPRRGRG